MKRTLLVLLAAVAALWIGPRAAESCGPFLSFLRFSTYHGASAGELESGRPGVLRPHYWRHDLLLSYRTLSGVPLSRSESAPPPVGDDTSSQPANAWSEARKAVPGLAVAAPIDPDRKLAGADFQSYPNCLADAFQSAAATLRKRIAQWGASSPKVAEWVKGQDQVFANCAEGASIPEELFSPDPLVVADRNYQIAAAQFYAERYGPAVASFDEIADSTASPWHGIAPYLAARACIRQTTVAGDAGGLGRAAERLEAIVADPAQKQFHAAAQDLLGFVLARKDPQKRLVDLGNQLMKPALGSKLARVLTDYTTIWDRMEAKGENPELANSDVADWVDTFQARGEALAKWRAKKTAPWLIAALVSLDPKDAAAPDLIAAAHAVKPESPAYSSAVYYGIRLQILRGDLDAARQWTDQALAQKHSDATMNQLRAERLDLARDWTEFLRFAQRKAVARGDDDGEEPLTDAAELAKAVTFDADATGPLNTITPLKLWLDATRSDQIPRAVQANIAEAGWVRAVILRDLAGARALAERVRQLKPELAAGMTGYLAETDPDAANYKAVFLMLRAPGLEPVIRPGAGRDTAVLERDALRDNWWELNHIAGEATSDPNHEALFDLYPKGVFGPSGFLPKDARSGGEAEWNRLRERAANSVNYLCAETLDWARTHPADPTVPQALHLAVEATHYGPKDAEGTKFSKQAFELLHRAYPKSEWTAKTKYWY